MTNQVSPFEFGRLTGKGVPMPADAAPVYYGHCFSCGCGDAHILNANIPVPREIPGKNKLVAGCPNNENVLNFLKVRGVFRIAGLEPICSTRINTEQDYNDFCNGVVQAQMGYQSHGPF
jgi:hypothetical protein